MNVHGNHTRTIWLEPDGSAVGIIDQLALPHTFRVATLRTTDEVAEAIRAMNVRGAPLIGAAAACGIALAAREDPSDAHISRAVDHLLHTRPTAVNLEWALRRMASTLAHVPPADRAAVARRTARQICDEDVAINERIGVHGVAVLREIADRRQGDPVNILTHCNAGWLATVDWGTALAPVYRAARDGIPVHVWVAETRPRLQGALTAWELGHENVPHTVVVDSAAAHLMQRGLVDVVITGADRVTRTGDVANKVGTCMKALAAHDNGIPFYIAAPSPTIDWNLEHGADIPIEERSAHEVSYVAGRTDDGDDLAVRIHPDGTRVLNVAFDVTHARFVSGLITEHGIVPATPEGLATVARSIGVERYA